MSFLLTSSEVRFFFFFSSQICSSFLFCHYYKCRDPGEQLLSVHTKAAVCLHNYFSLKQPSQSSLRKRTSCTQPWRPCWGRAGSSMVSFPEDAPAVISTCANNSKTVAFAQHSSHQQILKHFTMAAPLCPFHSQKRSVPWSFRRLSQPRMDEKALMSPSHGSSP